MKKILAVLLLAPGVVLASNQWTGTFKLNTGEEVVHTPTTVTYGSKTSKHSVRVVRGVQLDATNSKKGLFITVNQTKEQFIQELVRAGLLDPTKK